MDNSYNLNIDIEMYYFQGIIMNIDFFFFKKQA